MAKHLQRDASGHLMKEDGGHLANGCEAAILCDDCEGHGPITATITTTGSCEVNIPKGCTDYCNNGVVSLAWNGTSWQGTLSDATRNWDVGVSCGLGAPNEWRIDVTGGCFEGPPQPAVWVKIFTPEGCVTDNGNGYPTHSGINMGTPTAPFCTDDCVPTVALS